jgi:hypothetical protein
MTALSQYQRLECQGLWRDRAEAQRREVIVAFGDASLILRESPSERALAHWSLPAVIRLNPDRMPALFSPDPTTGEELELDDETMIAALTKVQTLIAHRQPRPGRLRGGLTLAFVAALALVAVVWLPGALITHTAGVLPRATRAGVGQAILGDLARLTGQPCTSADGTAALGLFSERLLPGGGQIVVLPQGLRTTLHLPGNIYAVSASLIENYDTPEVAAGYILAEAERAQLSDPLTDALRFGGLRTAVQLLTTGEVPPGAFAGYGERLLAQPPAPVDDASLLKRFEDRGVGAAAYARAIDPQGVTTRALIAGDPFAKVPPPVELISDTDWVALQGICGG